MLKGNQLELAFKDAGFEYSKPVNKPRKRYSWTCGKCGTVTAVNSSENFVVCGTCGNTRFFNRS